MILDVGCGNRPLGDVNVDIHKDLNPQLPKDSGFSVKDIPIFIRADGSRLPFRNEVFETVIASSSLEHSSDYRRFFKELLRVTSNHVFIEVPHILSKMSRNPESHKQYFTVEWFDRTLRKFGFYRRKNFDVRVSGWNYFPHQFLPFIRTPRSITVKIFKKRVRR